MAVVKQPFTGIENELYEKLIAVKWPPSFKDVLHAYIRLLNGFQKNEDRVSISRIMGMTGYSNRTVIDAQKSLQEMNVLIMLERGVSRNRSTKWTINKDLSTWRPMNTTSLVKNRARTYEDWGQLSMNIGSHTKEIKKEKKGDLKKIKERRDQLPEFIKKNLRPLE